MNFDYWFKLKNPEPHTTKPAAEEQPVVKPGPNQIGVDDHGNPIDSPLSTEPGHVLIVGPTQAGKSLLAKVLMRSWRYELWQLSSESEAELTHEFEARKSLQRHEPLLLVADPVHECSNLLPLLGEISRSGAKFGIKLLVTSQLLSDLPEEVWANCQSRFYAGSRSSEARALGLPMLTAKNSFGFAYRNLAVRGQFRLLESKLEPEKEEDFTNPLTGSAFRPRSAPFEESAPARQTPLDQWSMEGQAAPQGLLDHQLGSKGQPHRRRYSRTL
jgi:hypothetical protein